MEENSMFMKGLAVGIILFFVAIAFSPTINASNSMIFSKILSFSINKTESNTEVEVNSTKPCIKLEGKISQPIVEEKTRNRILYFLIILKNYGDADLQNVFWWIEMDPQGALGYLKYPTDHLSGSIEVLKPNETFIGRVRMNGYGLIWMHLRYGVEGNSLDKAFNAIIIGPFIIWLWQTFPYTKVQLS